MGLGPSGGGGIKNKSSSTTTTTTAATGYGDASGDNANVVAGVTAADGGTVSIVSSDQGAISAARDIALRGIDVNGAGLMDLLTGARDAASAARQTSQQAIESSIGLASNLSRTDTERAGGEFRKLVIILGVVVTVAFIAPLLLQRG